MKYMNRFIYIALSCILLFSFSDGYGNVPRGKKKKQNVVKTSTTPSKGNEYKKILSGKSVKTATGFMTLHKVDDKLYVELPLALLERDLVLISKVSEISDHTDCYVGVNAMRPLHVFFTKIGNQIQLRRDKSHAVCGDGNEQVTKALEMNNIGGTLAAYEIKAYNPDSTAVVIDMTELFVGRERLLSAIHARSESKLMMMGASYQHKKEGSYLMDVMSFKDNASIKSCLSYDCTIKSYHRIVTAHVVRTFAMLPEQPMQPRIADYRVPLQVIGKFNYKGDYSLMEPIYYALRWRLEPSDPEKFSRGIAVDPKRPVVFYLDTVLSQVMRDGIREGILEWNKTFEAIGFKNALQVRDYPKNDPEFSPDNMAYNCVRYVPSLAGSSMVQTYADPRTGELLNTTILVCHNFIREIPFNVIFNLGHADPSLRKRYLSDARLQEDVKYHFMWLVGTDCLGMTYNLTSSAAFPVDSLRSAAFTQKYGTSPSMLDLAKYNVAAPVDGALKGIRLVPTGVGEYDYFVVKWLYSPLPQAKTPEDEVPILEKWVSEKMGNPVYRYEYAKDCPDCGAGDVGNDDLELYKYGMVNLQYMMQNFDKWVTDEEDKDYSFRGTMYLLLNRKYKQLITQVATNVYGIKTYEKKVGDPVPMYEYMPKARQQKALDMLFKQMYRPEWMKRPELLGNMAVRRDVVEDHKDYFMLLINTIAGRLFAYENAGSGHITHGEYIRFLYEKLYEKTRRGEDLGEEDIYYQNFFFRTMMKSSHLVDKIGNKGGAANALYVSLCDDPNIIDITDVSAVEEQSELLMDKLSDLENQDVMAGNYGMLKKWPMLNSQSSRHIYYDVLKDMRKLISRQVNTGSKITREHYRYMLDSINQLMD